jgi:hypothetical protein
MKKVTDLPVIKVGNITEHEDGSASVELDLDPPAVQLLLDIGLNQLLKEHIEEQERKKNA